MAEDKTGRWDVGSVGGAGLPPTAGWMWVSTDEGAIGLRGDVVRVLTGEMRRFGLDTKWWETRGSVKGCYKWGARIRER